MALIDRLPLGVTAVMLPELGFEEQVALCRELGVTHYIYRPRLIPEEQRGKAWGNWGNHKFDLTPQRLRDEGAALRRQLEAAGLRPFGAVPQASADLPEEELTLHLDGAAAGGARCMRLAPPAYPRELFDYAAYLDETVAAYRRAVALARPRGVKLVIEMHVNNAAIGPGLAYQIVQHFDPAELGVILDLPNFALEGYVQPWLAVSVLADWVDHCHVGGARRTAGDYDAHGYRQRGHQMCALTESDLLIPEWFEAVGALGREVPLVIEDYTPNMPGALRLRETVHAARRLLEAMSA